MKWIICQTEFLLTNMDNTSLLYHCFTPLPRLYIELWHENDLSRAEWLSQMRWVIQD